VQPLVRRVWFTMVLHPVNGWMRVGNAYGSRKAASEWLPFVRGAWRGLRTRVSQCSLRFVDGVLDERSRRTLDEKYNLDPPNVAPHGRRNSDVPCRRLVGGSDDGQG